MSTVDHPAHYGGEGNPYEVIEVLERWLTSEEFAGFCKGNALKYMARAAAKGRVEDLKKAEWYQERLITYAQEHGEEAVFPKQYFWNAEGEVFDDDHEIVELCDTLTIVAVHSNREPFTRWAVRFPTSGDGDTDFDWFDDKARAEAFRAGFFEEADDEGCPKDDPDCVGDADSCHDACEAQESGDT